MLHPLALSRTFSRRYTTTTLPRLLNARLDYDFITSNVHLLEQNIKERNLSSGNPSKVVALHESYRHALAKVEVQRRERNTWSRKIPTLQGDDKTLAIQRAKDLKRTLQDLEQQLRQAKINLHEEALLIPNVTHPNTPVGAEDKAIETRTFGERRLFDPDFNQGNGPKDHLDLCQQHGLIDLESGTNITGPKFAVLRGDLAMLEIGLIAWTMSMLGSKGYLPTLVPDVCKMDMIEACGFNPRGPESQIYAIQETSSTSTSSTSSSTTQLGLIGTAEIPLAGLELDRVFETEELPSRVVGFSHAFRREAGARGSKSRGLYRLHQFSKVEMFVHCTKEQTDQELEQMVALQCDLLEQLGLHGRVLQMPTEELGASAHRKLDVEVWMPGRNEYGEVCSASDCTDYQSRRLNTQYVDRKDRTSNKESEHERRENGGGGETVKNTGTKHFASTLNATAMAVPRVMLAILETHQQADGTILVPPPMRPFLGKSIIGTSRSV